MAHQSELTLPADLLETIADQGLDALPELVRMLVNETMRIERQNYLAAAPYQRTAERRGHANGFKPKTVATRLGDIEFAIPQVREGGFYPQALEKGLRSERALNLALAEMYVQGVSTRKVATIVEQLCGSAVSSSQVSRAAARLDEVLTAWRNRPLGEVPYLFLDARYETVREGGQVRDLAILVAVGVTADGHRRVLGVSTSLGEQEVHWRTFLQSLVARGLGGVQLIISDDHPGLRAARQAVFGGVPWQRCQPALAGQARVPPATKCSGLRAAQRAAGHLGGRDPHHLRCARPRHGRSLSGQTGGQIRQECSPAGRLAGEEHSGRPDCIRLPGRPPAQAAHGQSGRTAQSGAQAPQPGREHLSQRGGLLAPDQCPAHRDR